jgi:hypothetical protein
MIPITQFVAGISNLKFIQKLRNQGIILLLMAIIALESALFGSTGISPSYVATTFWGLAGLYELWNFTSLELTNKTTIEVRNLLLSKRWGTRVNDVFQSQLLFTIWLTVMRGSWPGCIWLLVGGHEFAKVNFLSDRVVPRGIGGLILEILKDSTLATARLSGF